MAELTQAQWKRQLRREMEQDFRKKIRARIRDLKAEIKAARADKRAALTAVRAACKAIRAKHRAHIKQLRTDARLAINAERDRLVLEDRAQCRANIARATGEALAAIEPLEHALADERGFLRRDIGATRTGRGRERDRGRATRAERRAESDEQVEANIPEALVAVWRHVKRDIKPTGRMSRTEAFEQWVHDHAGDVARIQAEEMDRDIASLVAREAEERAQYEQLGDMDDAELLEAYDAARLEEGDVPF